MEIFHNAYAVRLRSSHGKYLTAHHDQESVTQDRHGSSESARWTVEVLPPDHNNHNIIRLKSCYNKYLTASNQPFLFGVTGRKVTQTLPHRLDSSVEWQPIMDENNNQVKLRTRYGEFLRANKGLPPWRNSVTHDIPRRTATQDSIFWCIDVVDTDFINPLHKLIMYSDSFGSSESSRPSTPSSFSGPESADSPARLPQKKGDGRLIYYHVCNEYGEVDEDLDELVISFKGNGVDELTKRMEDETGLTDITVCSRSPLNGKLYPLRLQLPPNNMMMNVVVVQSSSIVATTRLGGSLVLYIRQQAYSPYLEMED